MLGRSLPGHGKSEKNYSLFDRKFPVYLRLILAALLHAGPAGCRLISGCAAQSPGGLPQEEVNDTIEIDI